MFLTNLSIKMFFSDYLYKGLISRKTSRHASRAFHDISLTTITIVRVYELHTDHLLIMRFLCSLFSLLALMSILAFPHVSASAPCLFAMKCSRYFGLDIATVVPILNRRINLSGNDCQYISSCSVAMMQAEGSGDYTCAELIGADSAARLVATCKASHAEPYRCESNKCWQLIDAISEGDERQSQAQVDEAETLTDSVARLNTQTKRMSRGKAVQVTVTVE